MYCLPLFRLPAPSRKGFARNPPSTLHSPFPISSPLQTPEYLRVIHAAERSLRALEASAATTKLRVAQRDAIAEQLNYLVSVNSAGAADTEVAVLKAARASVENALEKDSALQVRKRGVATFLAVVLSPVTASTQALRKSFILLLHACTVLIVLHCHTYSAFPN